MQILADSQIPYLHDYFGHVGDIVVRPGRSIMAEDVADADMLLVRSITPVNQGLLQHSSVKFVGSVTAGADHLETDWLDQVGIAWAVASGFNAEAVAAYIRDVILALQTNQYLPPQKLRAVVVGVGHIGRLVAKQFQQQNIDVILCDPIRAEREADFVSTSLKQIDGVDIISLHVPLTKSGAHPTYHFIDEAFLKRQKPGCVLINASRGAVIDSNVLLQHGKHLHWCFDVWENEPDIDRRIVDRAVIATPHIAGYSKKSKRGGIAKIQEAASALGWISPRQPIISMEEGVSYFDVMRLSQQVRETLLTAPNLARAFDGMRQAFCQELTR